MQLQKDFLAPLCIDSNVYWLKYVVDEEVQVFIYSVTSDGRLKLVHLDRID